MPVDVDHTFKVLLLGDPKVGKTALILRFVDKIFSTHDTGSSSVGAQFKIRSTLVDGKVIKWHVSDATGSDRFFTITAGFLRAGDVILLTFDLTNPESFESLETWVGEVKKKAREDVLPVLVGCKSDGDRQVTDDTIREFAKRHKLMYFETSAMEGKGVEDMFDHIGLRLMEKQASVAKTGAGAVRGNGAPQVGWLIKRGSRWPHKWQRRWFVLDSKQLSYSREEAPNSQILGYLDIDAVIGVRVESGAPHYGFSLRTPKRTLQMRAGSQAVRNQWLEKFSDVIRVVPDTRVKLQHPLPELSRGEVVIKGLILQQNLPVSVHHPQLDKLFHASDAFEFYQYVQCLKKLGGGHRNIVAFHGFTALPIPAKLENVPADTLTRLASMGVKTTPAVLLDLFETPMTSVFLTDTRPRTLKQSLTAMLEVASAVEYLHSHSIVHTDIAANNIICTRDLSLKIRLLPSARSFSKSNEFKGRQGQPGYQSPESQRDRPWTSMVDVYALGVLLFEIAHQRSAYFYPGSPYEAGRSIQPGTRPDPAETATAAAQCEAVQGLINDMMSSEPGERPVPRKVVGALQRELAKIAESEEANERGGAE